MSSIKYIRLDIDNIGDLIELALLNNDIEKAKYIHRTVQKGMSCLQEKIVNDSNFEILMDGCDDILLRDNSENFQLYKLEELKQYFFENTSFTMSIGVGNSLQEALTNLKKAKYSGKNRIVYD